MNILIHAYLERLQLCPESKIFNRLLDWPVKYTVIANTPHSQNKNKYLDDTSLLVLFFLPHCKNFFWVQTQLYNNTIINYFHTNIL